MYMCATHVQVCHTCIHTYITTTRESHYIFHFNAYLCHITRTCDDATVNNKYAKIILHEYPYVHPTLCNVYLHSGTIKVLLL